MQRSVRDTVFGGVMLVIAGLLWAETAKPKYEGIAALNYGFPPSFYPRILLSIWAALAVILVLRAWTTASVPTDLPGIGRLTASVAVSAIYIWLIGAAGFLLATNLFTAVFMLVLGYRQPLIILLVTILFPVTTWWIMSGPLMIVLPESPWFSGF